MLTRCDEALRFDLLGYVVADLHLCHHPAQVDFVGPASRTGLHSRASRWAAKPQMPLRTARVVLAVPASWFWARTERCRWILPTVSSWIRRLPRAGRTWRSSRPR